jgi:hypothetical protein
MGRNSEVIDDKRKMCIALLDTSLLIPQAYREMIIETLTKVPTSDLEEIQRVFDRFIFLGDGTGGAAEHFLWQCMAKHKLKTVPPMFKEDKPLRLPELIVFDTFAIILVEHELNKMPYEGKMYIVAHELAHVFLKHRLYGSEAVEDLAIEEKADEQVKKWGFTVFQRGSPSRLET